MEEEKEYDNNYVTDVCPYCNHSKWVEVEHGGFFSIKSNTYKCSKCSRDFQSIGFLSVVPENEVRKIVQSALDGKINKEQMKERFKKIGISIYLPYKI